MASKSIKKWLADNAGATILMALLALLVVSMVAATILAAANSTVRQAKADQEFEQNSLSLQSAANFIAEDVKTGDSGFKVVASRTVTDELNEDGSYDDPTYGDWKIEAEGESCFAKQLAEAVNQVYYAGGNGLGYFKGSDSTISATFKNTSTNLDETTSVKATFEMEHKDAVGDEVAAQDTLVFELSPAEYDSNGVRFRTPAEDTQTLYVRFETKPDPSESRKEMSGNGQVRTWTETCVYTWNVGKFAASSSKV